jgi:glycosyltransferase involved in cell wall biosynthesis
MNNKVGYIPKDQRKKILLICDDIRVSSGIAHIAREMVLNTAHRYNYACIAGAINHPDKGKKIDISQDANKHAEINDASIFLYPSDGYGNPDLLRQLIALEKPDAIFLITDPRYFVWIFQMENEIRKSIPIVYLEIWDDYPAPAYNREFYESCDLLLGISKQTVNINKLVLGKKADRKIIKYVPHGLNHKNFFPLENNNEDFTKFKSHILKKEYDFVLLFNSRNIRRKSIQDTILAWKLFKDNLPKEQSEKCAFVLHTDAIDDNGTDLPANIEYFFPNDDSNIIITDQKFDHIHMNYLYNVADGVILLSSNEGWGLSLTEALLTGTPFIANVTGGMQDQMRFVDNEGKWYTPSNKIPSNHRATFKECGEWALPVFPSNISLVGSVPTPYIFDDRCSFEDAASKISVLYHMGPEKRKQNGLKGKEWATGDEAGFTSEKMAGKIIEGLDQLFSTWEPREKYEFLRDTDLEPRVLNHALVY